MTERRLLIPLGAYAIDVVVHLVAQVAGAELLASVTQCLAMPLLAGYLVLAAPMWEQMPRLVLGALFFSWLGDLLPRFLGDLGFVALLGCFLLAQITYIAAFAEFRREAFAQRPWVALCVVVTIALLGVLVPFAVVLALPVIAYGLALGTMTLLAVGVHHISAVGAALFLASDSMIATNTFVLSTGHAIPGFWVMATYLIGQLLIVIGVVRRSNRG